MTKGSEGENKGWFGGLKNRIVKAVTTKAEDLITAKAQQIFASEGSAEKAGVLLKKVSQTPQFQDFVSNVAKTPGATEAVKRAGIAVASNFINLETLDLFTRDKGLGKILTDLLSGSGELPGALIGLLSESERNRTLRDFIESKAGKDLLGGLQMFQTGVSEEIAAAITNSAFQKWLENNTAPMNPNTVPKTMAQASEINPEYFICDFCSQEISKENRHSPCGNCGRQEKTGMINVVNSDWQKLEQEWTRWNEKFQAKKHEFRENNIDLKTIGAAFATILGTMAAGTGIGLSDLFSGNSNAPDSDTTPQAMVRESLSPNQLSKHYAEATDSTRIGGVEPSQLHRELRETAKGRRLDLDVGVVHEGSVLAENVTLKINSTINGSVIVDTLWVKGVRGVEIMGDLVILGRIYGFSLPKVHGTIYLLQDDQLGRGFGTATSEIPGTRVTTCTIDKVYQIAREQKLI